MTQEEVRQIIREELANLMLTDRYLFNKNIQILNARNIQLGRTNGTKIGTATDQKLAFYGSTPVAKQIRSGVVAATFDANTSGIVNDSARWGSGSDNWTIGEIVAALKNLGLIV